MKGSENWIEITRECLDKVSAEKFVLHAVEVRVIGTKWVREGPRYTNEPVYQYVQVPSGSGKYRTYRTERRLTGYKVVQRGTIPAHWVVSFAYEVDGKTRSLEIDASGPEGRPPEERSGWELVRRIGDEGAYTEGNRYRLYYSPHYQDVRPRAAWEEKRSTEEAQLRSNLRSAEEGHRRLLEQGAPIRYLGVGAGVGSLAILLLEIGRRRRRWVRRLLREGRRRTVRIESERIAGTVRVFRFADPEEDPPVQGVWRVGLKRNLRCGAEPRTVEVLVDPDRPDRYYPLLETR